VELREFIVEAKKSTYANVGEAGERELFEGAREFTFEKEEFRYRDRYYGFDPFSGQEVVWLRERPQWVMNYYGGTKSREVPPKKAFEFLKNALKLVDAEKPFRGPAHYKEGPLDYYCESIGSVEEFTGLEKITFRNSKVYDLSFHGGLVSRT